MPKHNAAPKKPALPPEDGLFQALSLCRKAGKLVTGFDAVEEAALKGRAWLVLAAADASPKTVQRLTHNVGDLVDVLPTPLRMERLAALSLTAVMALSLTACTYDASELWEQVNRNSERISATEQVAAAERIAALETWQAKTNTNIQSTQALLGTDDCITAVTPVTEAGMKVGYTITFLNSPAITIYNDENGVEGITPQIGVTKEDDGSWYWTLNGDPMTDGEGNSIQADDDSAPVPQLSTGASLTVAQDSEGAAIVADAVYLSVDDGETWTRVSGMDGKSFFSGVDTSNSTCVTFSLADGASFSIARYTDLKLTFDRSAVRLGYGNSITVDFTAEGNETFSTDNLFIVAPDGWKVSTGMATRASTGFSLTVTAPEEAQLTAGSAVAEGDILVMLGNGQNDAVIGRIKADCKDTYLVIHDVTEGDIATKIGDRYDLTSITVTSGSFGKEDWRAIYYTRVSLLYIDLEGSVYTGDDANEFYYQLGTNELPLIDVKLPQGVTGLRTGAFRNCLFLPSITLPEELTIIRDFTFYGCEALTSIDIPDEVTSIGESAFERCSSLTSIILPEGLQSIGYFAFQNCTSITSVTLPASLKSIGRRAFEYCSSLTSVILPEELTTIEIEAFHGCSSLSTITLPEGLTSIREYAFENCTSLTTVTCLATAPPELSDDIFSGCKALTAIYVPAGSVEAYRAATGWSDYADIIQAIP